jgi:hypothetical protein
MYIAYLDESFSKDKRFQIVGGVLIKEGQFETLESILAFVRECEVPEDFKDSFEFHASDLFNQRGRFQGFDRQTAIKILEQCVHWIKQAGIPIFYGAVDVDKHVLTLGGDAEPVSVGFRICLGGVESWITEHDADEIAIAIFDNIPDKAARNAVQKAFRLCRKRMNLAGSDRGQWKHLHDDLYFGDSEHSVGIQAADICTYFINRHLNKRLDTEYLYEKLKDNIFCGRVYPESE